MRGPHNTLDGGGSLPLDGVPVLVLPQGHEVLYANTHSCRALGLLLREADLGTRSE